MIKIGKNNTTYKFGPNSLKQIKGILDPYVEKITKNRDKSHGIEHARKVSSNALIMFRTDYSPQQIQNYYELECMIYAVGILHDVFDSKYDKDDKLRIDCFNFCTSTESKLIFTHDQTELIMMCIDRISFSKENKLIKAGHKYPYDWTGTLKENGLIVRNYVSDSDKHDAQNVKRCIWYILCHVNHQLSDHEVSKAVIKHSNEKLLRLPDFIRTKIGKNIALKLDKEMRTELESDNLMESIILTRHQIFDEHHVVKCNLYNL